nr:splicing factor, proline- and glutamine-rich-like [Pongo abelii]
MAPGPHCPSTGCGCLGQAQAAAPRVLPGRPLSGQTPASSSLSRPSSLLLFWWWVWGPSPPATATSAILPHPRASFKNSRWAGLSCSGRLCPPSPGSQCQMRAGDKSSIFLVLRGWQWGLPPAPHGSWQPCPLCRGGRGPAGPTGLRDGGGQRLGGPWPMAGAGTGQPAGRRDLPSSPTRVTGRAQGRHFHFLALEKAPPSSGTSERGPVPKHYSRHQEPIVGLGRPSGTSRPRSSTLGHLPR